MKATLKREWSPRFCVVAVPVDRRIRERAASTLTHVRAGPTAGVQSITSVTVGGTVATAGSFNVVVARRLAQFDIRVANASDIQSWDVLGGPQLFSTSCLWPVMIADSTSTGTPSLDLAVING